MRHPFVKRQTSPLSGLWLFFPRSGPGAGCRQARVLPACPCAGPTQAWLPHTRIAAPSPRGERWQKTRRGLCCGLAIMLSPQTVLLCGRCCQAPCVFCRPCLLWTLCHMAPTGLAASGGVGTPPSPTTFSPCELARPSPASLCVLRREREGRGEATPARQRLFCKARTVYTGRLHPPQGRRLPPHCHTASASFRTAPAGKTPLVRHCHSARRTCRATAPIPMRRRRWPPPPKRSRHQHRNARSGG